jgi:hypothetical protein
MGHARILLMMSGNPANRTVKAAAQPNPLEWFTKEALRRKGAKIEKEVFSFSCWFEDDALA